jgi:hypothetical protein
VLWASATGRLLHWRDLPWPIAAVAAGALLAWLAYIGYLHGKPPARSQ